MRRVAEAGHIRHKSKVRLKHVVGMLLSMGTFKGWNYGQYHCFKCVDTKEIKEHMNTACKRGCKKGTMPPVDGGREEDDDVRGKGAKADTITAGHGEVIAPGSPSTTRHTHAGEGTVAAFRSTARRPARSTRSE